MKRNPRAIFGLLCVAGAALITVDLMHARKRVQPPPSAASISTPAPAAAPELPSAAATPVTSAADARAPTSPADGPSAAASARTTEARPKTARRLFFRHNGVDAHYGQVAWVDVAHTDKPHFVDSLSCEVVYVSGGRGI